MIRSPARLGLLLALALPCAARGQAVLTSDLASGIPVGLPVPNTVAGADEPDAVSINPAGVGFVGAATLQYFFANGQAGSVIGNGLYAALPLGPLVPALSLEWMSPAGAARYLKTELALAFAWQQIVSVGVGWNFYSTPGPELKGLLDIDIGLTVRPAPFLSLGASVLGLEGRVSGEPLPVRYAFGAAGRFLDGALQAALDAYANDGGGGAFRFTQGAATVTGAFPFGLVLQAQYLFPLRAGQAPARQAQAVQLALTWNLAHVGITVAGQVAGSGLPDGGGMLYGARVSAERYRSRDLLPRVEVVDLGVELRAPTTLEQLVGAPRDRYGALLLRLRDAARDPSVAGLLLELGDVPVGLGRAAELRAAVACVAARKPVVAFLSAMSGTPGYWIASAATELYVAPGSVLVANGLARQSVFLKDGLARLGVAFEAVAVGPYKNAPDALTRSRASEPQREVTASLLDSQISSVVDGIASGRRLSPTRVRELVEVGLFDAEEARRVGLVDGALWPDEVEERARAAAGGARLARGVDESRRRSSDRWGPQPFVAVIRVEGAIAPGRSRREPFTGARVAGADTVVELLRSAAANPLARAVVLRVDSPGGDGFASDLIWRAVGEVRRAGKPVVASMGDVAASGGYLVSVGATAILAEPTTLTGSIGVFALKPDLSGLLAKLDVNVESQQRGANARIDTFTRAWTPEERAMVERQVSAFYGQFLGKVAEGRHLPGPRVEEVARGRVWTGEQARERGLVDRMGGLEDALELAKELGGLDLDAVVRRTEPDAGFPVNVLPGLAAFGDDGPSPAQVALSRIPEIQAAALLGEMGTLLALPEDWLDAPRAYPSGK